MKALKSAIASFIATIVLSASGIALAADDDAVEPPAAPAVVATDTRASGDADGAEGDAAEKSAAEKSAAEKNNAEKSDVASGVESNSTPAATPQPTDAPEPTPEPVAAFGKCSTTENADGSLVQKCTGEDAEGDPVAKSSVELPEKMTPSRASKSATATTRVQNQTARTTTPRSAQSVALPVANSAADTVVATGNPEVEKPKLPITGTSKSVTVTGVDKETKGGSHNAASAVLETENSLIAASSRASLFTMVACAAFIVVGAGSVVSVRRLKH